MQCYFGKIRMCIPDDARIPRIFDHRYLLLLGGLSLLLWGCGSLPSPYPAPGNCLEIESRRIDDAPALESLQTLDGQSVPLAEFKKLCHRFFPNCVLYPKFYHWKNEIIQTAAQTPRGTVWHRVRTYYNLLSTCYPDRVDPGRTHGDVAEFYDEKGVFMGLAVNMGKGLYCPLPYTGYHGTAALFDTAPQFKREP